MKGIHGWDFKPYRPYDHKTECELPFICRLAPGANSIELEWFDRGFDGAHEVWVRGMRGAEDWTRYDAPNTQVAVTVPDKDRDYELCVVRLGREGRSAVRYARTGDVPGTIVNYLHPEDELYAFSGRSLCSPSLVRLPSGALLASMDVFAGKQPQNLTLLFRSDDDGANWRYVADLFPCYWGTLFLNGGRLYMLSTSTEYGDVLIAESRDEGTSWDKPSTLFVGSGSHLASGWQHTPMPIIEHCGRIWTCIDYGAWSQGGHGVATLSAPVGADLTLSENWTVSELAHYDPAWQGAPMGKSSGLLEGNMVVSPEGRLIDILRAGFAGCEPSHGIAVALEANSERPEEAMRFHQFIALPSGSNSKTHILRDPETGYYAAIGNIALDDARPTARNVLALQTSKDMYNWKVKRLLLDYRDCDPDMVGFQYISFIIDGDDILYLSRTSLNRARNFHDANYQTFHRIENFRRYF